MKPMEAYGLEITVAEQMASEKLCMSLTRELVSQFGDLSVSATSFQAI